MDRRSFLTFAGGLAAAFAVTAAASPAEAPQIDHAPARAVEAADAATDEAKPDKAYWVWRGGRRRVYRRHYRRYYRP